MAALESRSTVSTAPPSGVPRPSALDSQNPYAGLQPFAERDSPFFFGRDDERAELARLVRREVLTVLFGRSGLGKTSLLNASLYPLLRQESYLPLPIRLDFSAASGRLAAQLGATVREVTKAQGVEAPEMRAEETLWEYFHRAQFWSERNRLLTPLLVFDQFEEIFTLGRGDTRLRPLLGELSDLIENQIPGPVLERLAGGENLSFSYERQSFRVIFSLREDFLPDLEDFGPLIPAIARNRFRLKQLTGVQALEAILRPGGDLIGEDVARQILRFLAGGLEHGEGAATPESLEEIDVEPALLSLFCRELNEKRQALKLEAITGDLVAGEREKILHIFYERSMADLPHAVRAFVEDRLLTGSGFRRSEALEDALHAPGVTEKAITILVNRRLLSLERRLGSTQVELIHDRLTRVIQESRDHRHRHEYRRRIGRRVAVGAAALIVLALGSLGFGLEERRLKKNVDKERARTVSALNVVLFDVRDSFSKIGKLASLEKAQRQVYEYFDSLPEEEQTPDSLRIGLVSLNTLGDIYSASARSEWALKCYSRSLSIAQDLVLRDANDPVRQRDLEVGHRKMASVLDQRGKHSDALVHYRAAFGIATQLTKKSPQIDLLQQDVLASESALSASLLDLGNLKDGFEHLNRSVELAKSLVDGKPNDPDLQSTQAESYRISGAAELGYGRTERAVEYFNRIISIETKLREDDSDTILFRLSLGEAYRLLGSAQFAQGKVAASLESYDQAFEILRRAARRSGFLAAMELRGVEILNDKSEAFAANGEGAKGLEEAEAARKYAEDFAHRDPSDTDWQISLASSYGNCGEARLAQGQAKAALRDFEQEVKIIADITTANPGSISFESDLGAAHFLAGRARSALGDSTGARKEWMLALELLKPWAEQAGRSDVLELYARSSIALGRLEDSRPVCEKLRERGWNRRRILGLCREKALLH
jgi:tetratricopeptide (TPR) repeat protein